MKVPQDKLLTRTDCSDSMSSTQQLYLGDAATMSSFSKDPYLSTFDFDAMASSRSTLHNFRSLHEQWPDGRNEVHGHGSYHPLAVNANRQVQARG